MSKEEGTKFNKLTMIRIEEICWNIQSTYSTNVRKEPHRKTQEHAVRTLVTQIWVEEEDGRERSNPRTTLGEDVVVFENRVLSSMALFVLLRGG